MHSLYIQNALRHLNFLEEIKPDFPDLQVEEVDMTTPEGQAMIGKYMVMSSPGIVIDGELFSQGGLDKSKLIDKLKSVNWFGYDNIINSENL